MGQSPLGAGFTTASAGSARNAGTSSDPFASHTPTTPGSSGVSVYPAPPLPTTTSRAVTGAPSQNWTSSEGGRRWAFTLRADAQFWDGAPVTAREVVVGKGGAGYTLTPLEPGGVGVWQIGRASGWE